MSGLELFLIGIGLSMDAFAVAVTDGLHCPGRKQMLAIAGCFGLFQGLMPTAGFLLGNAFSRYICAFDHWIALLLLGWIGGTMLADAIRGEKQTDFTLNTRQLLMQGVATSIDAMAVGVSFAALGTVQMLPAALLICGVTFAVSLTGAAFGRKMGAAFGSRAQMCGGVLLIGMGIRIFMSHVLA